MADELKNDGSTMSGKKEERESVRGKLEYYQELIHLQESRKKAEEELELNQIE